MRGGREWRWRQDEADDEEEQELGEEPGGAEKDLLELDLGGQEPRS